MIDTVNNPKHYISHPSGVECIEITEHLNFNRGNAIKYVWRNELKGASYEDLQKAAWYIKREIQREKELSFDERFSVGKKIDPSYDKFYRFYYNKKNKAFFSFVNHVIFGHETSLTEALQIIKHWQEEKNND